MGFNTSLSEWNEPVSVYPKKYPWYLSLRSEQKPINSYKVGQHNETKNPKRFSKNRYNFQNQKIRHIKEKKIFLPSVYMKMNSTFNYLINYWKNESIKYFFPFFFSICIYENESGESANLLTLFKFCQIGQGNVFQLWKIATY